MTREIIEYKTVQAGTDPDGVTPRYVSIPTNLPPHRERLAIALLSKWTDDTLMRWLADLPKYGPSSIIVLSDESDLVSEPHYVIHLPVRHDHLQLGKSDKDALEHPRCPLGRPGRMMPIQAAREEVSTVVFEHQTLRLCGSCFPFGV